LAFIGISAAKAEPDIVASAVAAKIIFFMTIPIRETSRLRMPPSDGLVVNLDGNLKRAESREKPKCQASAAFLGVREIPRQVVCVCCIPTTNSPRGAAPACPAGK
jgi:hypothetical protein